MYRESCKLLDIPLGADIKEAKSAYRKKAKQLHPDLNPSKESHIQFISIRKAYEYIVKFETVRGRLRQGAYKKYENDDAVNHSQNYKVKNFRKREYDLLGTKGGIIFYTVFHLFFILTSLFIMFRPLVSLLTSGLSEYQNTTGALITLIFSFLFGAFMIRVFVGSVYKTLKAYLKN